MNFELQCTTASDVPRPRPKSLLLSKHTWLLSTWPSVSSDGSICIPAHYNGGGSDSSLHNADSSRPGSCVGWEGLKLFSEASGMVAVEDVEQGVHGSPSSSSVELCCTAHKPPAVKRLVKSVTQGLKAFQEPERALNGMGGTYFFLDERGRKAAILKPCDEEPLAPNNPNGFVGRALGAPGWKPTVRVGEAAMREVAAYLLDHDHFAKVPTTVLVRARHACFHTGQAQAQQQQQQPGPASPRAYTRSRSMNDALDAAALERSMDSTASAALDRPLVCGRAGAEGPGRQDGGGLLEVAQRQPSSSGSNSGSGSSSSSELEVAGSRFKLGSLQEFVQHDFDTSEMGASRFPVRDVQRIGILDIRLFNTDRHAGNILVRRSLAANSFGGKLPQTEYGLIPIDHGFCLPEALDAAYFEWLHWPQALLPFGPEELGYIASLDVGADIALLRSELPSLRPECFCVLEVTTTLLQKCAAAGLCLAEIGSIMSRPTLDQDDDPSPLEQLCVQARAAVDSMTFETYEEEGGAAAAEAWLLEDHLSSPSGSPSGMLPLGRVNENEELMFDLEEESHRRSLDTPGPSSSTPPTPFSSSFSSSTDQPSPAPCAGCPSPLSCPPCLFDTPPIATPGATGPSGLQTLSMSLSGRDRDYMGEHQGWSRYHKTRNLASPRPVSRADSGVRVLKYPPPVAGAAPQSVKDVFSNLSEAQWQQFMRVLSDEIDAGLGSGQWRSGGGSGERSVAASCPHF